MRLTISSLDKIVGTVDVPEDTIISGLKLLVSVECGLSTDEFALMKDGSILRDTNSNVLSAGFRDGDLIVVVPSNDRTTSSSFGGYARNSSEASRNLDFSSIRIPRTTAATSSNNEAELVRQALLNGPSHLIPLLNERNPELASALNDPARFARVFQSLRNRENVHLREMQRILQSDPLDPSSQARIAELIRQKNIDMHMEAALEHYPETFAQVSMLFVNCKVGNHPIKAFVDSGAQSTIMSEQCARQCNLEPLIDKRWAGMAYGVGTQQIIGRVHNGQLEIGGIFLPTSFIILKDQPMDLMIGLDMLRRHQCCIDLKRNVLTLDAGRVETPFLPESEIPLQMRHAEMLAGGQSTPPSRLTSLDQLSDEQRDKVLRLTDQGVPYERAIIELETHGWDVQEALISYMSNS